MTLTPEVKRSMLLPYTDFLRDEAYNQLDRSRRATFGQYFTPSPTAQFMASLFSKRPAQINLLDPGAGVGALTAATITEICGWEERPASITVTAYEIEPALIAYLRGTLRMCQGLCCSSGIRFNFEIVQEDFIASAVAMLQGQTLFEPQRTTFNHVILNPPYHKLNSHSSARRLLRKVGIETSNLYAAFVWLAMLLLEPQGEIVAITPRSFCNGSYFKPYREALLKTVNIKRIHIFESRTTAFEADEILQENIIFHAVKDRRPSSTLISSSTGPNDEYMTTRNIDYAQLVQPNDPNQFIHIVPDELGQHIGTKMRALAASLSELGLNVSTGRVVDFRAKHLLRDRPDTDTAPLIYPGHLSNGRVAWPNDRIRKCNALTLGPEAEGLLVPSGFYVLVKRFSAKEEKRRIVAALYDSREIPAAQVGFENHLNYYHAHGKGLSEDLAKGLVVFLNSTLVDQYFRQFNGHTQVNVTDLRNLNYPRKEQLIALGRRIGSTFPGQDEIDRIVQEELGRMSDASTVPDPIQAKKKLFEALAILKALNLPPAQQNDRSALTLLALLDLKADTPWSEAAHPQRGITEMMEYFKDHYGVVYAPNTRETVRRQTVHQFLQVGLIIANPDDPSRPVNSPHTRYQIEASALQLLQTFGTAEWERNVATYLATVEAIRRLHAKEREMSLIPVKLPDGSEVTLSGGGQNILIKDILEQFCPRFTPGGVIVYLGDAGQKLRGAELEYLRGLSVELDEHGQMPDVIIHMTDRNWLVLIEAVTSHGPIDIKRHNELRQLFKGSQAPVVFVTAFATRKAMMRFLTEIAWETEVWIADAPSHLIHFNGDRFLGPHEA